MKIIKKIMDVQMSILECKTGASDLRILDNVILELKSQQNKINILKTENKELFLKLEQRNNDLLKTKGFVNICDGAGQCDFDGSTCNKYNNCGEYHPVIKKLKAQQIIKESI